MNKLLIVSALIFLIAVGGFVAMNNDKPTIQKQQLTQENYKVLSRIVPIGYGQPNDYDIDTELNLRGVSNGKI